MTIRILPAAAQDIVDAAVWYEAQRPGLGAEFHGVVTETLRRIEEAPDRHRVVYASYRRCRLRRFPYTVVYRETDEHVLIYAVYHQSRDPRRLRARLKGGKPKT